jgi:hypothetical protein
LPSIQKKFRNEGTRMRIREKQNRREFQETEVQEADNREGLVIQKELSV